jgi:hypothetical protein
MFQGTQLDGKPGMPSKPMIMNMLSKLKDARVLKVLVQGRGRRVQVLALSQLINLCEGRKVM